MANPQTTDCDIQIRIFVDENTVQDGSDAGVYIVDNRVASGSAPQGAVTLNTVATINEKICWRVQSVNPQSASTFTIQSIGGISAWGPTGTPSLSPDLGAEAYTGTVEEPCSPTSYNIESFALLDSGNEMTISVKPSILVT